jgi:hypothetical protein
MGKNKRKRKQNSSESRRITEHEAKIRQELAKANPDRGLIQHWKNEISGWKKAIERRSKTMPKRRTT